MHAITKMYNTVLSRFYVYFLLLKRSLICGVVEQPSHVWCMLDWLRVCLHTGDSHYRCIYIFASMQKLKRKYFVTIICMFCFVSLLAVNGINCCSQWSSTWWRLPSRILVGHISSSSYHVDICMQIVIPVFFEPLDCYCQLCSRIMVKTWYIRTCKKFYPTRVNDDPTHRVGSGLPAGMGLLANP